MKVTEHINKAKNTLISFEVLQPLKGKNIQNVYDHLDPLMEFKPSWINVTYHRSETAFKKKTDGTFDKVEVRKRPGTVGICAAIMNHYQIDTVPHFICGGFTKRESEDALIDLNFLGIDNQNLPYYNGFEVYVKAVYSPGVIESGYLQTYQTNPPALSTNNYADKNMNLYPNPTSGIINIENVEINKVTIFDILGKSVKEYDNLTKIDLSELSKGIYTLKIIAEKQIFIRKIILK